MPTMITLNASNSSASIFLDAWATITVSARSAVGTLSFTSSAKNLHSDFTANLQSKTYGPFGAPGTITLNVTSGSIGYAVAPGFVNQAPITAGSRTTQCGHSFQSNGWVGAPPQVNTLNALMWASTQLNQGFDIVNNYAAPGTTIQDMITSQLPSVVADDSDIADVDTGINDLSDSPTTGVGITAWETLVRTACTTLSAAKKLVLWRSIDPAFLSYADRALEAVAYNEVSARVCSEFPNVLFVDSSSGLLDTTQFAYQPLIGLLYDGVVHPNTTGAYRRGLRIAKAVRGNAQIVPGYNVIRTTLMPALGTSGGTPIPGSGTITQTASIPANMSVTIGGADTGTVVVTAVAPSGNQPKRLRLTITTSGNHSIDLQNTNTGSLGTAFVTGDIMRAFAKIRLVSQTNLTECSLLLNRNGQLSYANQFASALEIAAGGGAIGYPAEGLTANLKTPPLVATGSSSTLSMRIRLSFSAAGGATFDLYDGWGVEALSKA